MTELSYTAWDDNRYQWPPPEGWYQASDGKWWPEGYGPVAAQTEVSPASEPVAASGEAEPGDPDPAENVEFERAERDVDAAAAIDGESVDAVDADAATDAETAAETAEAVDDLVADAPGGTETVDAVEESVSLVEANGYSDAATVEADVEGVAHGGSGAEETGYSPESRYDTDSYGGDANGGDSYSSESQYSTSTAGMAATGFASRSEGGSSSFGLAGWAQSGASDVRNRVDAGQEYDYSPTDGEPEDLLDPLDPVDPVDESLNLDDVPTASSFSSATLDTPTEQVDATLSRLDDLKREVEQQSFARPAVADATTPVSDLGLDEFDPTETLDIDPNDLSLESNPYYGGSDESSAVAEAPTEVVETPASDGYHYGGTDDAAPETPYVDRREAGPDSYGYVGAGEANIDAPPAAEAHQYGYESDTPPPVTDQPIAMGEGFGAPTTEYGSGPTLTPMSSPPPSPGAGRTLLYVFIGLLALGVAGAAGYLLFQLQSDDDGADETTDGESSTSPGSDVGASDTSAQGPGSFSNPHELEGGVRLTVPTDEGESEVWMLQVRSPAETADAGGDLVEVTSRVRVRNDSTSGDLSASGLRFVLVSADGSTATTAAPTCSEGDDLNRQTAIEPGRDIEGNVCWTVPAAQATGALLGIESVEAAGRVHVHLS